MTSAPHAAHAQRVEVADLALNAATLNGHGPDDLVDWTQMIGIPGNLVDGDDDTLGGLVCTDGQVARWNGSAWNCADDAGQVFGRTFIVGPVGDPPANGSALLAAMAAIPTPGNAAEAWLLKIEPGRYDLGTDDLTMKDHVDIEGAGTTATTITSASCVSPGVTVIAAADCELRGMTIENRCADPTASPIGVHTQLDHFSMRDLLVRVNGSASDGIGIYSSASWLTLHRVRVMVSGPSVRNTAILLWGNGGYVLDEVVADARGGSTAWAVDLQLAPTSSAPGWGLTAERCIFRASTTTGGPAYAFGMWNSTQLDIRISGSRFNAQGSPTGFGINAIVDGDTLHLDDITAIGSTTGIQLHDFSTSGRHYFSNVSAAGTIEGMDIGATANGVVIIDGGTLQGPSASITDGGFAGVTAHISNARLIGPASLLPGSFSTCTAVTDATPTFYASTCP